MATVNSFLFSEPSFQIQRGVTIANLLSSKLLLEMIYL